ncbi:NAD(P)/FAD-dependent oxidoreductase [Sanyastnella coralliicola]|uniref:NAD(P)/FAD-dependent oxidoreductase n=1 Tax=Sanyastnella coralliicola TaxID=3069118 RepID=UPI0027B887F7|nr:FAD/NAD(P)-binding oxidoreductase [Longitalea sp. SCSIO 12813]
MKQHYQVVIIGGGTGGIMTAAQLLNHDSSMKIAVIEPAESHFYQPAWTLVGAGAYEMQKTERKMSSVMPSGVTWIKDYATTFEPENNAVNTRENGSVSYDYLIVSPGLQMDLDGIEGLREALQTESVCSNYIDPEKTYRVLQNFKGGNALFTQPATPIKCGGAPQKIMYLAEEYFKKSGVRDQTEVIFATPGSVIFGVQPFKQTLEEVIRRKRVHLKTFYSPYKIDPVKKEVYFKYTKQDEGGCVINEDENVIREHIEGEMTFVVPYDMLHLAPPQSAPDFVKQSPFAHQEGPSKGWMDVDKFTLQHSHYKNVFGLGDVCALPTAKTGAAIRKQAPVVVDNILEMMKDNKLSDSVYEGYSSCPLVTGYGKMVLAEFKYDNVRDSDPLLSKFMDTSKEKWALWVLKKHGLPYLYWNRMMKGRM